MKRSIFICNIIVTIAVIISLWYLNKLETQKSNHMWKGNTCSLIAITGEVKVPVLSGISHRKAAITRRELMQADEHFDMLGHPTAKFRIKHTK